MSRNQFSQPVALWLGQHTKSLQQTMQQAMQQAVRLPSHVVTATALLTLLSFAPPASSMWRAYQDFASIVRQEFRLRSLSDQITYLDEVLTMSARMNAATGDPQWERRYHQNEPQLNAAIQESIQLAPQAYQADAVQTDAANQALVAMELQSFDLVQQGKRAAAMALLLGRDYRTQKQIYADGVAHRNQLIQSQLQVKIDDYRQQLVWSGLILVVSLVALLGAWLLVLRILQSYLQTQNVTQAALETANHQLEQQVQDRTQLLEQKNLDLQQALQKLQSQQMQLVQSEKMSSLGHLVAGIAHEINNPVSFVHGNIEYIEEYVQELLQVVDLYQQYYPEPVAAIQAKSEEASLEFLQQDLLEILRSMRLGTNRIRQIVLSMRNFSRMDETGMKGANLHEGIDNTLMILRHRLKATATRPEIPVIKQYGELTEIECFPGQLNQVLMNVLANAIDALEEIYVRHTYAELTDHPRGITITTDLITAATPDAPQNQWVQITIADQGAGITAAVLPRIFDPFFTTKPTGKGTGLGMSISYQIITEKHRGTISCSSIPGEGSEFVIRIPFRAKTNPRSQTVGGQTLENR